MRIPEILRQLPGELAWMVLFDLPRLRLFSDDADLRAAFLLPPGTPLDGYSHMVLSSAGKFLAPTRGEALQAVNPTQPVPAPDADTLSERYARQLSLLDTDQAHCVGLGEQAPWPPVLMSVQIDEQGVGEASAVFEAEPDRRHYGLLRAAGVVYLDGEQRGDHFLARFRNRIPTHLLNARLADYSRTAHCNWFFLQHGQLDERLLQGLRRAAAARTKHALDRCTEALCALTEQALAQPLAMDCLPPPPAPAQPMGDLVPLGLALGQLRRLPATPTVATTALRAREHLLKARQGRLWSFQSGRLITATDSALVLQGVRDEAGVEALEIFADGEGGYYPQRWAAERDAEHMAFDETVRPWCQRDYATTCLVRGLRRRHQLPERTPLGLLEEGFETRGGLYFANPYLTDWALAQALADTGTERALAARLRDEILASQAEDAGFGQYDRPLSTALAILALQQLGYRGPRLRTAQLRLLDWLEEDGGAPVSTPFYSALYQPAASRFPQQLARYMLSDGGRHVFGHQGRYFAITRYQDGHRLIGTALTAAALAVPVNETAEDTPVGPGPAHPRYRCENLYQYIQQHALPPYLAAMDEITETSHEL